MAKIIRREWTSRGELTDGTQGTRGSGAAAGVAGVNSIQASAGLHWVYTARLPHHAVW